MPDSIINVELNTNLVPFFSGTYYSMWEVTDYDDDGEEVDVSYDFNELMKSIIQEYNNHDQEIIDWFSVPWIKSIKFTGSNSPREYNFSTDTLDFTLEIDRKEMMKKLNSLKGNKKFYDFLRDHYTSYDGFMSWTPNTYQGIYDGIVGEDDNYFTSMGAFIRFVTDVDERMKSDNDNIELDIHEDWQSNGYGGLDWTSERI